MHRHLRYKDIEARHRLTGAYVCQLVKHGLFPAPLKTPGPRGCALFDADVVDLWAVVYRLTSRGRQKSPTEAAEETMRLLEEIRQADDPRAACRELVDQLNREAAERDRWHLPLKVSA